jgi:hypothetical protein
LRDLNGFVPAPAAIGLLGPTIALILRANAVTLPPFDVPSLLPLAGALALLLPLSALLAAVLRALLLSSPALLPILGALLLLGTLAVALFALLSAPLSILRLLLLGALALVA